MVISYSKINFQELLGIKLSWVTPSRKNLLRPNNILTRSMTLSNSPTITSNLFMNLTQCKIWRLIPYSIKTILAWISWTIKALIKTLNTNLCPQISISPQIMSMNSSSISTITISTRRGTDLVTPTLYQKLRIICK